MELAALKTITVLLNIVIKTLVYVNHLANTTRVLAIPLTVVIANLTLNALQTTATGQRENAELDTQKIKLMDFTVIKIGTADMEAMDFKHLKTQVVQMITLPHQRL